MKRKRAATPHPTIEKIISESYGDIDPPDVIDFLIGGPFLDISLAEERFLVEAYTDSQLEWEVRKRVRELGRGEPWIETLARSRA